MSQEGTKLRWESAGTDEPGDQNADSRRGEHAYWSLGPMLDDRWSVELIVRDDDLNELPGDGVHLGHFGSEDAAKEAAQAREDEADHLDGDGCASYPDMWYGVTLDGEEVDIRSLEVGDVFTEGGYDPCEVISIGRDIEGNWHIELGNVPSSDATAH